MSLRARRGGAARGRGVRAAGVLIAAALAAAGASLAGGCGADTKVAEVAASTRIDALEIEIKTRIGPAVCTVDSDCRALPMGALPCGGPSSFLPYSIRGTDEVALKALSADHQRLSAEQLVGRATVGNCLALLEPVASCQLTAPVACKLR